MTILKFVIWTPSYADTVGGVIALHALCDRLTQLGYNAALWPSYKPARVDLNWPSIRSVGGYLLLGRFLRFNRGPFANHIASSRFLRDAIVVYPEIVSGNPLGAGMVVRWLLHRPGYHTGVVDYGQDDLFFYYNKAFDDPRVSRHGASLLRVSQTMGVYRQINYGPRSGSCYLIRKGKERALDRHPVDAILVDSLSHSEKALVFNQTEFLYCYDEYTYYAVYAALCGCTPIIIPEPGKSEEEWEPDPRNRLGRAYGEAKIEWARATRDELRAAVSARLVEENESVRQFAEKCRRRRWPSELTASQ